MFNSIQNYPEHHASTTVSGGFWSTADSTATVPAPAALPTALVGFAGMGFLGALRYGRRKRQRH